MMPRRMARARVDDVTADMTRERRRSDGESAAAPHPSHPLATPPRSDTTTRRSRTLFAERPRGLDRDAARRSRCRRRHRDRDRPEENSHINRGKPSWTTRGSRGGQVVKSTMGRRLGGARHNGPTRRSRIVGGPRATWERRNPSRLLRSPPAAGTGSPFFFAIATAVFNTCLQRS